MPISARQSGSWQNISSPAVRVGGSYQNVIGGFAKQAGVWENFYSPAGSSVTSLTFGNLAVTGFNTTVRCYISVRRSGDLVIYANVATPGLSQPGPNDWIEPRNSMVGIAWWVRLTRLSGEDVNAAGSLNSGQWYNITVDREFGLEQGPVGSRSGRFRLELSPDGGSSIDRSHDFDWLVISDLLGGF